LAAIRVYGRPSFSTSRKVKEGHPPDDTHDQDQVDRPDPADNFLSEVLPGNGCDRVNLPLRKIHDAPGWQAPQVLWRLSLWIMDFGSEEGRISCTPWQLAQLAENVSPPRYEAVKTVIVGFHLSLRDPVLLRDLFCRVTLGHVVKAIRRSLTGESG